MAEQGLVIIRVFDAPRERVWREWTEPERFADWFGGADAQVPMASVSMDVRPGGTWRATMLIAAQSYEGHWIGEYREVRAPERLVFTISDQPDKPEFELCTVVLTDLGDGRTEMRFAQSGGHLTPEGYEAAKRGWGGFFAAIDRRLAAG